ncbi:polymer-forming cytoskeletal protein [Flavobacterium sp. ANB]|uniref:polymer-forming cytoskeletal protein n=1 Tax=unclassified Flavobacterium TaxID=196869 RepID=UPI0012B83F0D|nr:MULTISPECIES: polymer-forming cytoskeletal protein [unclassified Flavobacterium]MBF4517306.1 polymer-forming cytoskeletal protein [Flavobacterium sp. ANB]MTD70683.1 polymer-forming cytoskeletal protein [Flavobacterium sp. LC2016-13]
MHNSVFKLITIKEVKSQYPFLLDHEGFDYFEEWNDDDFFFVANQDVYFDGNFHLDIYEDKIKKWFINIFNLPFKTIEELRIEGILINGNIFTNGSIINAEGDYGPYVFISGNVTCKSLLLGGSYVEINGNVNAKEVVMTSYNHGNFKCSGVIDSPVFIVEDHYTTFAERKNDLFYYNDKANDFDSKNDSEYDDESEEEIISNELRKHLNNPLIETFEELKRELEKGELVLKLSNPAPKTFEYWQNRVASNYRDLKLVPHQFKTKELCDLALNNTFHALPFVNQEFITQELCERLVDKDGFSIQKIPDEFITEELCLKAAKSGTLISLIPKTLYSEKLILTAFKNGKHEPNITDVPSEFITENLLEEYVKISKGLWLDKVCKENGIDKLTILKRVIDSGIESLDSVFGNHFSKEVADYSASVYDNESQREKWNNYIEKYKVKFERLGLSDIS